MLKLSIIAVLVSVSAISTRAAAPITFTEDFSTDPGPRWKVVGDSSLFHWNSTAHNLGVTWDSAWPKSFFYLPLGKTIGRDDHFQFEFDLTLTDIASGHEAGKNGPMQIGVGFLNFTATNAVWSRVDWPVSENVAEFNVYPSGFYPGWPVAATTAPAFVSSNGLHYAPRSFDDYILEFPLQTAVHVKFDYDASTQVLTCSWSTNGVPIGSVHQLKLDDPEMSDLVREDDFAVNMFSISSYKSNEGDYANSVLAHGVLDNISITIPSAPAVTRFDGKFIDGKWQIVFRSKPGWIYALERTTDAKTWEIVRDNVSGTGADVVMTDASSPNGKAYYRVRATQ